MAVQWFSIEYNTLEDAQGSVGRIEFFSSYAVFETPKGRFVVGEPRIHQWSKSEIREIAENVEKLTGNRMVSYTDALFGWMPYRG